MTETTIMNDKQSLDIDSIEKLYSKDIKRLQKMIMNMYAVANIRFIYYRLKEVPIEITTEYMMEVEALTTALVVGYGKLFASTTGVTKLNPNLIPEDILPIHEEIIALRNQRYAHHGKHSSVKNTIKLERVNSGIRLIPNLELRFCFGAPKEWGALFVWLDGYMHDEFKSQLEYLTKVSGISWVMPEGSPPPWLNVLD